MQETILVRYGEIFLKGRNKGYFESVLISNIKRALHGLRYTFVRTQNRYHIEDYDAFDRDEIVGRLQKVFGLHSLSVAAKVATDYDLLAQAVVERVPADAKTFRITVNRADKRLDKNSTQIAAMLGGKVLEAYPQLRVDLHRPQAEIMVDIRERGYSYVFCDKILCAQGMPVGTSGKGM